MWILCAGNGSSLSVVSLLCWKLCKNRYSCSCIVNRINNCVGRGNFRIFSLLLVYASSFVNLNIIIYHLHKWSWLGVCEACKEVWLWLKSSISIEIYFWYRCLTCQHYYKWFAVWCHKWNGEFNMLKGLMVTSPIVDITYSNFSFCPLLWLAQFDLKF